MGQPDVIVIGGGVVGAACAHALAHRGVAVTLLEPGPEAGAATPAAAGMLAPFAEAQPDDPMLSLAIRARDLYAELVPALEEETGHDVGFRTEGIAQLAVTSDDVETIKEAVTWQRQAGFPVEWLSVEEVRELLPGVGPDVLGAGLAPEDGALDPSALRLALLECARRPHHGATLIAEPAEQILFEGERVSAVRTPSQTLSSDAVVVAAGCWSGRIRGLPRSLPVEPVRGQILCLAWPEGEPPAIVYAGKGYVMERAGEAIAGSTMERVGFDASTTPDGIIRIRETVTRIYPALATAEPRRTWAGLRPVTPDSRPLIGLDPRVPNLWYATGHGRNGILLAAMTGQLIAQQYAGDEIEYDLAPVSPSRFWTS
jgi:glycine oxidase